MTLGCAHVFCPHGRMESLRISYSHWGKTLQPAKTKARAKRKRAESHRSEVNTLGSFACNISMFFKVSQRD